MISYVKGELAAIEEQKAVIDVGGIGYGVYMPQQSMARLPEIGSTVKLHTYLNVKEDAMQLYGFFSREDLEMFRMLLGVNGIGPKAALGILSGLSADELRFAVLSEDTAAISKAPGVGKKTAQKLILELKDKLDLEDAFEKKLSGAAGQNSGKPANTAAEEAVQALTALGYSGTEALQAVRKVEAAPEMDAEEILKAALKFML